MHIGEYAVLGALTARALSRTKIGLGAAGLVCSVAACALFGMLDEWHQSFVPGRDASGFDVLADVTGAVLALSAAAMVIPRNTTHGPGKKIEIKLFGRRDCHLCDEAEKVITEVCAPGGVPIDGVIIEKVDVDTDASLVSVYGDQVPVVTINGRKHFKHSVEPERLRRVLASIDRTGRR